MKVHELIAQLLKFDQSAEVHLDISLPDEMRAVFYAVSVTDQPGWNAVAIHNSTDEVRPQGV